MQRGLALLLSSCVLLSACGTQPLKPSDKHIQRADAQAASSQQIPPPLKRSIPLPPPKALPKVETYSVVVTNVSAQEILFALARDARINIDIYPGIQGNVTLNAINQTLPQILDRIARQIDMRYEIDGPNLAVMPDTPYLKQYKIDYVNMSRETDSSISTNATVGNATTSGGNATQSGSSSTITIKDVSKNSFWNTLVKNIKDILRETDKVLPAGSSETVVQQNSAISTTGTGAQTNGSKKSRAGIENSPNPANLQEGATTVTRTSTFREAASVIDNPETGIITVRATGKQHEKIQEFIDQVMASARRQVMIEATIAEVELTDQYQQGIDWSLAPLGRAGFTIKQTVGGTLAAPAQSLLSLAYNNTASRNGSITALVNLLDTFGTVKVLSSPKLSVLNNQTAVLKVVDNNVYFTIKADTTATANVGTTTTYTTTLNTVPVGFVMNVTPQISDSDEIILNVHPSVSRILTYVNDPNPALKKSTTNGLTSDIVSQIPVIRTREMESMLRIENGNIAVMGGLMEDSMSNTDNSIPGISKVPGVGEFFKNKDNTSTKRELVVFLRPIIIRSASINGDFSAFKNSLPDRNFFKAGPGLNTSNTP